VASLIVHSPQPARLAGTSVTGTVSISRHQSNTDLVFVLCLGIPLNLIQ
jgi:hypothetical protein